MVRPVKLLIEFQSSLDASNRVIEVPDREGFALASSYSWICSVVAATIQQMTGEKLPPVVTVVDDSAKMFHL